MLPKQPSLSHTPLSTFSSPTRPHNPLPCILQKCIALLQSCASSISKLKQIHAFSIRHGVPLSNPDMGKHLIFTAVSLQSPMAYAHQAFSQIQHPNVFTWNTMTRGYAESRNPMPVIQLYNQMRLSCIEPDTHTYPFLLKAVAKLSNVRDGEKVHRTALRNGLETLVCFKNALLHLCAVCGQVESARKVFESMSVINGFSLNGRPNEALTIFREMTLEGVAPDGFTMVSLLCACAELGALALGGRVHVYMVKAGLTRNAHASDALLDVYVKCGSIREAQKVFGEMEERSVVSLTALAVGLGVNGFGKEAFELFQGV